MRVQVRLRQRERGVGPGEFRHGQVSLDLEGAQLVEQPPLLIGELVGFALQGRQAFGGPLLQRFETLAVAGVGQRPLGRAASTDSPARAAERARGQAAHGQDQKNGFPSRSPGGVRPKWRSTLGATSITLYRVPGSFFDEISVPAVAAKSKLPWSPLHRFMFG